MIDVLDSLGVALAGRYSLERELGRGGMATVYLAQDLRHDRPIAVKVRHPDLAATLDSERFQREIRVAAQLPHPQILPVYDSGVDAGALWFTMP
jgi:serine/threonine-protein kinase